MKIYLNNQNKFKQKLGTGLQTQTILNKFPRSAFQKFSLARKPFFMTFLVIYVFHLSTIPNFIQYIYNFVKFEIQVKI